jgi:hypothetical protein
MLLLQLLLSLPMVANQSTQLAELLVKFQRVQRLLPLYQIM